MIINKYTSEAFPLYDRCLKLETFIDRFRDVLYVMSHHYHYGQTANKDTCDDYEQDVISNYNAYKNLVGEECVSHEEILYKLFFDMFESIAVDYVENDDSFYNQRDYQSYYDRSHNVWGNIIRKKILEKSE